MNRLKFTREGSEVRRCHTMPILGSYTVGQHSFNAVNLVLLFHPNPSLDLIKAVLWHDLAERHVGDMPSPARWLNPNLATEYEKAEREVFRHFGLELPDLPYEDNQWLKAVDKLELFLWAKEQVELGNNGALDYVYALFEWFTENKETVPNILLGVVHQYQPGRNGDVLKPTNLEGVN